MSRRRKFLLTAIGSVLVYVLGFGPIWGWYTARNQPAPAPIAGFYAPIRAAFGVPGLALPLGGYLYIWELIYGGH
jgi:hypothetical protein